MAKFCTQMALRPSFSYVDGLCFIEYHCHRTNFGETLVSALSRLFLSSEFRCSVSKGVSWFQKSWIARRSSPSLPFQARRAVGAL